LQKGLVSIQKRYRKRGKNGKKEKRKTEQANTMEIKEWDAASYFHIEPYHIDIDLLLSVNSDPVAKGISFNTEEGGYRVKEKTIKRERKMEIKERNHFILP
jgi:hypothetical protein